MTELAPISDRKINEFTSFEDISSPFLLQLETVYDGLKLNNEGARVYDAWCKAILFGNLVSVANVHS